MTDMNMPNFLAHAVNYLPFENSYWANLILAPKDKAATFLGIMHKIRPRTSHNYDSKILGSEKFAFQFFIIMRRFLNGNYSITR